MEFICRLKDTDYSICFSQHHVTIKYKCGDSRKSAHAIPACTATLIISRSVCVCLASVWPWLWPAPCGLRAVVRHPLRALSWSHSEKSILLQDDFMQLLINLFNMSTEASAPHWSRYHFIMLMRCSAERCFHNMSGVSPRAGGGVWIHVRIDLRYGMDSQCQNKSIF